MADPSPASRGRVDREERDRLPADLEELRPFIALAREIKRNVDRITADDSADVEQLSEAIAEIPRSERQRVTEAVFDRLPADVQFAILERVFGGDEICEYLEHRRRLLLEETKGLGARRALTDNARAARLLDTREVPEGEELVIGLFREADVRSASTRGRVADNCARSLVLRSVAPARFRVIEDVFNPRGGLFVTREYDETTWAADRFPAHATVMVGAETDGLDGPSLDPVIYLGGRADFSTDARVIRGRLHIGFVLLGDIDVFAD